MKQEFPGQRSDEELIQVFRRHATSLTKAILALIALSVIGFLPYAIVPDNVNLVYIGLGGVLVGLLILFRRWVTWYFSYYILTDQRIRHNRQQGLFRQSTVDLALDKVQSAAVNTRGIASSLLGYGTIIVHTQVGDMVMTHISHAGDVYDKLQAAVNAANIGEDYEEESE